VDTKEPLLDQLNCLYNSKTLILTIGNTLRGDDAAGPLLFQQLKGRIAAEIIDAGTVPENYIQTIIKKAPEVLLVIDAIDFSASPGTIKIFKPDQLGSVVHSTHSLSPHLFIDMIRKSIKVDVYLIGVQPAQVGFGQSVCAKVAEATQRLVDIFCDIFPKRFFPGYSRELPV